MEKRNLQFKKHAICELSRNGDHGIQKMYSFKDICDFMNIEPKERTRIGRKVKPYAEKIKLYEGDKEKTFTYVTKTGVLYMIRCLTGIKKYLYYYFFVYNFNSIISGSGQPQIVRTPLEKLKITLPTISEQKQKAIIFDKIQDKIDINHKVLNLYIGQKQYLLRQMFI